MAIILLLKRSRVYKFIKMKTKFRIRLKCRNTGLEGLGLSSKTMEATTVPGLYFIGEGVDVTGHLGGHNFQWAWSSGHAAGEAV